MNLQRIFSIGMGLAGLMVVGLGLAINALAQPTAERTVQMQGYQGYMPDVPMSVRITVIQNKLVDVNVVESPPTGWTISSVSPSLIAVVNEGMITWNIPSLFPKSGSSIKFVGEFRLG